MAKSELREELLLVTNNFDRNIDQVMRKIDRLNNKTKSFGGGFGNKGGGIANMLQGIGGKMGLDGGVMNLIGSVGKLGTAFGAASLAAEGFNQVIERNDTIGDEFGRTTESMSSAMDTFLNSLAKADFSNFIDDMKNAISTARELYDAEDDLQTLKNYQSFRLGDLDFEYRKQMLIARDRSKSEQERLKALEKAKKILKEQTAELRKQAQYTANLANKRFKNMLAENGLGNVRSKDIEWMLKHQDKVQQYLDNYKKRKGNTSTAAVDIVNGVAKQAKIFENFSNMMETNGAEIEQIQAERNAARDLELQSMERETEIGNVSARIQGKITSEVNKQTPAYKEHATLTEEIQGNIKNIEERLKKLKPSSQKYKELTSELNEWKRLLDADAGSLRYQNSLVSELQDKLQRTDLTKEDEFRKVTEELEKQKGILDEMTATSLNIGLNLGSNDFRKIQQNVANLSKLRELYMNNGKTMEAHTASLQLKAEKAKVDMKQAEVDYGEGSKGALVAKVTAKINEIDDQQLMEKLPEDLRKSLEAGISGATLVDKANLERIRSHLTGQYQIGSKADLEAQISAIQKRLDTENLSVEVRTKLLTDKGKLENELANLNTLSPIVVNPFRGIGVERARETHVQAQQAVSDMLDLHSRGLFSRKGVKKEIEKINKELAELNLAPIQVHIETNFEKEVYKMRDSFGAVFEGFDSIDNMVTSFESLTSAMDENANAWKIFMSALQTTMSIINAVTTVMETVNLLQELFGTTALEAAAKKTAATQAEAAAATEKAATDTASIGTSTAAAAAAKVQEGALLDLAAAEIFAAHAAIPFAGVGIADGLIAQMIGTMSATAASTKLLAAFANGGVVGGSAFAGDRLLARVNSGEMILNGSQQKNLFDLIDGGVRGGSVDGNVVFKIHGQDLYGTLKNYTSIKSKTTNVTKLR